ncbi:MAG TPA: hypothetical protein VGQ83_02770 [Polyangia bacterium]|jgi:hypothetical protein
MTALPWHLPGVADRLADVVAALELDLRVAQAPHGLDAWDERRLQHALAAGLRPAYDVALEAHYPSTAGRKLTHRQRCDLVLTPRGRPLRQETTLLPFDLCPPEEALWIELKLAHQRGEGGAAKAGYGTKWRRQLVDDLRKMAAEPCIREAALVLVVFTDTVETVTRDLDTFEALLAEDNVLAGFRHVRNLPIVERIGHRVCTVALWPTVQAAP